VSARRAYSRTALSRTAPHQGDPRIYSVSEIVLELHDLLEFEYPSIVVQGEVSDYKPHPSGHDYFCLKDGKAQLQVAFFANRQRVQGFRLENGIVAQVEGRITVFEKRGSMQLLADRVAPVGYGALQAKFEALKKRLQLEGLFATERKHLPDVDVARSAGWRDHKTMKRSYQQPDPVTTLRVIEYEADSESSGHTSDTPQKTSDGRSTA